MKGQPSLKSSELSFHDFYNLLLNKSVHEKGKNFERFIQEIFKNFLLHSSRYESLIKEVYLWSDWQNNWGQDIGIDLVAETQDEQFIAIQCKFHKKETTLKLDDVKGLLSLLNKQFTHKGETKNFTKGFIMTTSNKVGSNVETALQGQTTPCHIINYTSLEEANLYWDLKEVKRKKKKKPRVYQKKAVEAVYNGFTEQDEDTQEVADKGKLIMACGTGKTYTSLKIIERLEAKKVLFLVPSLSLLGQTVEEYNQEKETKQKHLIVCSDTTIRSKSLEEDPLQIKDLPATTNKQEIQQFLLEENEEITSIIFSTYQSLDKVEDVLKENNIIFDLVICDEAHRTTGISKGKNWQKIHNQEAIRRKKTLFMTATPRVYSDRARKKAEAVDLQVFSMDDEEKYGQIFFSYYFTQAIRNENLSDYKVIILTIPTNKKTDFNFISHIKESGVQESLLNFLNSKSIKQKGKKVSIINSQEIVKEELVTVEKEKITKLICFANSIQKSKKITAALK